MDQKKDKDTQHEMLRTGCGRPSRPFAVLSGVGIYLAVFVGICLFLGSLADTYLLGGGSFGKLTGISSAFRVHSTRCSGSSSKTGLSESFCSLDASKSCDFFV